MDFHVFAFVKLKTKTKAHHPDMSYISMLHIYHAITQKYVNPWKFVWQAFSTYFNYISSTVVKMGW